MKIAFFDSGMGGLSVLHHAMKLLPKEEFIFYADEDNVPYGTKERKDVLDLTFRAFCFLAEQKVDATVVACNTATSVAVKEMRQRFSFPVIGMEPAVKIALNLSRGKRVLCLATPITVQGEKLKSLIDRFDGDHLVDSLALPRLVEFAEKEDFTGNEVRDYLRRNFAPYDFSDYGIIVLGCTHFNYFKDSMQEFLPPHFKFVDGNEGTVRELMRRLSLAEETSSEMPKVEYFYSGRKVTDPKELSRITRYLDRLEMVQSL